MKKDKNIIQNETELKKRKDFTSIIIIAIILLFVIVLSIWLYRNNREKTATALFENALEKINEFDDQSNIYSKQEMEKEIVNLLDQVIANYKNTIPGKRALFYKGYILYNTKNYEKAEKIFDFFINNYKNNYLVDKSYYFLSYCYSENKETDKAIDLLKNFIQKHEDSYILPAVIFRIANLYELKGNKQEAILYYQKIIDEFSDSSEKDRAKAKMIILKNNIRL